MTLEKKRILDRPLHGDFRLVPAPIQSDPRWGWRNKWCPWQHSLILLGHANFGKAQLKRTPYSVGLIWVSAQEYLALSCQHGCTMWCSLPMPLHSFKQQSKPKKTLTPLPIVTHLVRWAFGRDTLNKTTQSDPDPSSRQARCVVNLFCPMFPRYDHAMPCHAMPAISQEFATTKTAKNAREAIPQKNQSQWISWICKRSWGLVWRSSKERNEMMKQNEMHARVA